MLKNGGIVTTRIHFHSHLGGLGRVVGGAHLAELKALSWCGVLHLLLAFPRGQHSPRDGPWAWGRQTDALQPGSWIISPALIAGKKFTQDFSGHFHF